MLKLNHVIEKQKEQRKKHFFHKILSIINKNIKSCKKMNLCSYTVPLVFLGVPTYNTHELYKFLKVQFPDYDLNIIEERIIIRWKNREPKIATEIPWILERIKRKIEQAIKRYQCEIVYKIPTMIEGIPMFEPMVAFKSIKKILSKEQFEVEETEFLTLRIKWSDKAKFPHAEKPKDGPPGFIPYRRLEDRKIDYRAPVIPTPVVKNYSLFAYPSNGTSTDNIIRYQTTNTSMPQSYFNKYE